jgi:rod shape-determining protein MreD
VVIAALRWALILVTTILLQTTLIARLPIAGERGDVVLLIVIAAGIAGGSQTGAIVGFVFGLTFDLLLQTPLGLSALAYCLTGYAVGALQTGVLRAAWWIPVFSAIAGSAIGVVTFALVGAVVGQDGLVSDGLAAIIVVVALINAVLVLPAVRVVRWALAGGRQARLSLR